MTGYVRAAFGPSWSDTDRNGCDQRNDVLRTQLQRITLKAGSRGCTVLSGVLTDPYTGGVVAFRRSSASSSSVEIDHVVPLADAWAKGALGWSGSQRTAFANDPLNLLAVGARVNAQKGAGDAATWLPPAKGYRCAYVARQVAVKAKYRLSVTSAERTAIARILGGCPATVLPAARVAPLGGWPTAAPPVTAGRPSQASPRPAAPTATRGGIPTPEAASPPAPGRPTVVRPGAFCAPQGARAATSRGTSMRCSTRAGDVRARWRAA